MATLPIGFFMPLPLPIMIPFMMWQSAAIAAGFGTYFQYAKRRVSAMSNEEFNKFSPSQGVNEMFDDIMANIPSSFERIRGVNNLILQSLADFLEDGIRFLSSKLGGQLGQGPFQLAPPGGELDDPRANINPLTIFDPLPPAGAEPFVPPTPPASPVGPPAPALTQQQLLDKYANWETYRSKGGLLQIGAWKLARRGKPGGLAPIQKPTILETKGRKYHPAYFRQLKSLQNNRDALFETLAVYKNQIKTYSAKIKAIIAGQKGGGAGTSQRELQIWGRLLDQANNNHTKLLTQIAVIQEAMEEFVRNFKPNK